MGSGRQARGTVSNGNATEWAAAGLQTPAPLELNRGEPEGEPEPELAPELPTVVT